MLKKKRKKEKTKTKNKKITLMPFILLHVKVKIFRLYWVKSNILLNFLKKRVTVTESSDLGWSPNM